CSSSRADREANLVVSTDHHLLNAAVHDLQDRLQNRQILILTSTEWPGPAATAAQKMESLGCQADLDFDALRQGFGKAFAALQYHGIGRHLLRADDVERHVADLHQTVAREKRSVVGVVRRHVNSLAGVHRE